MSCYILNFHTYVGVKLIEVLASPTYHRVVTGHAVQGVVGIVAEQDVVQLVAAAVDVARAGQT